jgi:hypothetical protein
MEGDNLSLFRQQAKYINELIELLDRHINQDTNINIQLYIPHDIKLSLLENQLHELKLLTSMANNQTFKFIGEMNINITKLSNDYKQLLTQIQAKISNYSDIEKILQDLQEKEFKILEQMTDMKQVASHSEDYPTHNIIQKLLEIKNTMQIYEEQKKDKLYFTKCLEDIKQNLDCLKDMKKSIDDKRLVPIEQSIQQSVKGYLNKIPQLDNKLQSIEEYARSINLAPELSAPESTSKIQDLAQNKYIYGNNIQHINMATNNLNIQPAQTHSNGFTSYLNTGDYLDKVNYEHLEKYEKKYIPTDLNKDITLKKKVVKYYRNHLIKWIKNDSIDMSDSIKTESGVQTVYNLLKQFVKDNNVNWYDLRNHHSDIKTFIKRKIL